MGVTQGIEAKERLAKVRRRAYTAELREVGVKEEAPPGPRIGKYRSARRN